MIITTVDGQVIDTDKLSDLDALVYEKLRTDMEFWAKYGLSFYTIVKFNDQKERMTAAFNTKGLDIIAILTWFKMELEKGSNGRLTLDIKEKEPPEEDYGQFPESY